LIIITKEKQEFWEYLPPMQMIRWLLAKAPQKKHYALP
jgi:hypothetical protein